jgi:HSP20 family protein
MVNIGNLIPFGRRSLTSRPDPFEALRREIDALFDRPWGSLFTPSTSMGSGYTGYLSLDVYDKDDELIVKADTPGLDEKDLSINFSNGLLTIQGEKKIEERDQKENYFLMERSYGQFMRSIQLPFQADPKDIKAKLENGVLTITIKKPKEAMDKVSKIKIESK